MRCFDYAFLATDLLPSELINLTASIYQLNTANKERQRKHQKIYTELAYVARIQSVKSSNAIEGIITSDERIRQIVNRSSAPKNHDEMEIAGYRDALNLVHTQGQHLDFCGQDIKGLHALMMRVAGYSDGGQYKTIDNVILEVDDQGRRSVRFQPTPAHETEEAMEQLVLAYQEARANPKINPLLLIPCVILDFLCIHPFRDGNGRVSRLLTLLLTKLAGFDVGRYISFEEQINQHKDLYYEALHQSSQGWQQGENSYVPFILDFLSTLNCCYKDLDHRFAVVGDGSFTKTARIEAVVLNSLVPVSKAEILSLLPDISQSTVEKVLGDLVRSQRIIRLGKGRGTRYIRNKDGKLSRFT